MKLSECNEDLIFDFDLNNLPVDEYLEENYYEMQVLGACKVIGTAK